MVRHIHKEASHPHHTLVIRLNRVSTSGNLGSRIVMEEKRCQPPIRGIWEIFTRLHPMTSSEEELIGMMNQEVPGLGEVARVFGTHGGGKREEDIWEILSFFMGVHMNLDKKTPQMAWNNPTQTEKLRKEILTYAKTWGHNGSI